MTIRLAQRSPSRLRMSRSRRTTCPADSRRQSSISTWIRPSGWGAAAAMAVHDRSGATSSPMRVSSPRATVVSSPAISAQSSGVSIEPSGSAVQIDRYSRANMTGSEFNSSARNASETPQPVPSGSPVSP